MESIQNITVTSSASEKVKDLLKDDGLKDENIIGLRVFVQGGGCSGFSYGFVFESEIADDDDIIEKDGIKFIIDPMSMMYLDGSTVDYNRELAYEAFVVNNPNAKTTCGCGSSFSV